jgi:hypothetical protein
MLPQVLIYGAAVYLLYIVGEYVSGFDSIIQQFDKWYRFLVVHFSCLFYSSKFVHNFHLSETSFTCPRLWERGLRLSTVN